MRSTTLNGALAAITLMLIPSIASAAECGPDPIPELASSSAKALSQLPDRSPFLYTSKEPHRVRVLSDPAADLEMRLREIETAKTIDLEYYVFTPDRVGRAILQACLKRARAGARVRVIVDAMSERG